MTPLDEKIRRIRKTFSDGETRRALIDAAVADAEKAALIREREPQWREDDRRDGFLSGFRKR